jgi:ABC-type bacteriocin/lantibiotic exporter with double-glycine peptidase domain
MPRRISPVLWLLFALCAWASAEAERGVWVDVPFIEQQREGCGAAAIAMVMQYWQHQAGRASSPAADSGRILRALHANQAGGIYASDMIGYFRRNGFLAFAFAGQWQDLQDHLGKGRPLIAALKPGASLPLHYVVIAGLDPDRRLVILNDPAQRKLLKEDAARFEQEWKAAGHWTLLALPEPDAR